MIKLNKTIKTKLVADIIAKKYKKKYEKALDTVSKELRKTMIKASYHNEFKTLDLGVEMLSAVQASSSLIINYLDSDIIEFVHFKRSIQLSDPVYGYFGSNHVSNDFKPLLVVRELIKKIEKEQINLSSVIMSYTTAKKLIHDLPWIKKHLPAETVKTTVMIPVDKLKEIGESFGSL